MGHGEQSAGTTGGTGLPGRDPQGGGRISNEFSGRARDVVQIGHNQGGVHLSGARSPLDQAILELREMVAAQWKDEAAHQQLFFSAPLSVQWTVREAHRVPGTPNGPSGAGRWCASSDSPEALARTFRSLRPQRLVIVGPAGSGKTTLAMQLTLALAATADDDDPVPVLLPISGWNPEEEHLHSWLARRIEEDYSQLASQGGQGTRVPRRLVDGRRIVPVLDGLDELPASHHAAALQALNRTLAQDDTLIVTCRAQEYAAAVANGDAVGGAVTIEAQPVQPASAADYLAASVPAHRRADWSPVLAHLRGSTHVTSSPLKQALRSALTLWLALRVHEDPGRDPARLLSFTSASRIERHLAEALIPSAYARFPRASAVDGEGPRTPRPRHTSQQAHQWLSFLSFHERQQAWFYGSGFAWWRLLSALGPVTAFRSMTLLCALGGLLCGLTVIAVPTGKGLLVDNVAVNVVWVGLFVTGCLMVNMVRTRSYRSVSAPIRNHAMLRGMWAALRHRGRAGYAVALTAVFVASIALIALLPGKHVLVTEWARPLVLLSSMALLLMLNRALSDAPATDISRRAPSPTALLRADRRRALRSMVLDISVTLLSSVLLLNVLLEELTLSEGLYVGLTWGTTYAWFNVLTHHAWGRCLFARTVLALQGRLPWRLIRFLEDARARGLLRRMGGVYEFRHKSLQDGLNG